jgi:hypothetical protein
LDLSAHRHPLALNEVCDRIAKSGLEMKCAERVITGS